MNAASICPRCSECEWADHHWLENPDFGNDPDDAEYPVNVTHICKHCDATGSECEACDGTGEYETEDCVGVDCPDCGANGVIAGATVDLDGGEA